MDLEQQAAYRNLLDHAWLADPQGYLPDDDAQLAGMSGWGQRPLNDRWNAVKNMFKKTRRGLASRRQLEEVQKQYIRKLEASKAGKASAASRRKSTTVERPLNDRSTDVNTAVAVAVAVPFAVAQQQKLPFGEFDIWYSRFPKKIGKGAARKAYVLARKKVDAQKLLDGVARYAEQCQAKDPQYICHPATWLNQERWCDECARPTFPGRRSALDMSKEEFLEIMGKGQK